MENPFRSLEPEELDSKITEWEKKTPAGDSLLICWDAPLTGPPLNSDGNLPGNPYSQRPIDSFFAKSKSTHFWGTHKVTGISVQNYSGCQHWAITQALLGYPQVSNDCKRELHWELQTGETYSRSSGGRDIAEVHPALALWLMLPEGQRHSDKGFRYKGTNAREEAKQELFNGLKSFVAETEAEDVVKSQQAGNLNDDELDALTAWVLGRLWTTEADKVRLLGNETYGTFLLPADEKMEEKFKCFVS